MAFQPKNIRLTLIAFCILAAMGSTHAQKRTSKSKRKKPQTIEATRTPRESIPVANGKKSAKADNPPVAMELDIPKGAEHFIAPVTREEKGKTTEIGRVDWTTQYIEATGQGVIDLEKYKNPAQAKALAIRGATVVAQRNLLEIVKGVNVQGETTVEDMMTTRDFIVTRVEGIVKGAMPIGVPIEKDGIMEVRLRMPLYSENSLANAVYDAIPATPQPKPIDGSTPPVSPSASAVQEGVTDPATATAAAPEKGLAFQMNGKILDPSLFPVVIDESGNVVLNTKDIYQKDGKFPKLVKGTKEMLQQVGFRKGVDVLNVIDTENGKIRISNADASKFPWAKILNIAKTVGKFLLLFI